MSNALETETAANSLTSWEDLLEGNEDLVFQKLNEAIQKIQISAPDSKKVIDPFASKSIKTGQDGSQFNGYRHLAILSGKPINTNDTMYKLRKDFGQSVRLKFINDSNAVIVFANVIDARHAVRSSKNLAPLRILAIDDPEFQHSDFIFQNRDELLPVKSDVRPPTNMSAVRNAVSRHLNLRLPASSQHIEEKEQLKRAREAKKAKADLWK